MARFAPIALLLLFIVCSNQQIVPSGCIQFSSTICIRCSLDTHIYEGLCYRNIIGCLQYKEGETCMKCDQSISNLVNGNCQLIINQGPESNQLKMRIYEFGNPGDRYGQRSFMPTTYDEAKNWKTFMAVNQDIRTGQYSHFISRSGNPVYSIHYYIKDNSEYRYKILYEGSGGGIFLLFADISENTLQPKIRSFVTIALTQLIDNCIDYDSRQFFCLRCRSGYHLEDGQCYRNTGNCIKYFENICLQCLNYHVLVENRCVSDCQSISDFNSVLYYRGRQDVCSLQTYTGRTISYLYSFSVIPITTNILQDVTISVNPSSNSTISINNGSSFSSSSASASASASSSSSSASSSSASSASSSSSTLSQTVIISGNIGQRDPNCAQYSNNGLFCEKCSNFFYKQDGICVQVSPYCRTYDEDNGNCTSCYTGYQLKEGDCSFGI